MSAELERRTLILAWKQPVTRLRYLIGYLQQDSDGYHFSYETETPRSVLDAEREGFRLLDEFPDLRRVYHSTELFPTFRRRARPLLRWRQLRQALAAAVHGGSASEFDALQFTGGRMPTDTFEFLEPMYRSAEDSIEVQFPVAGWRYYGGNEVIGELPPGTPLRLQPEPDNEHDPSAIRILSPSDIHLGYVPTIYSWYLEDLVRQQAYDAQVVAVGSEDDPQSRLIVRVQLQPESEEGWPSYRHVPSGVRSYEEALRAS